MISYDTCLSLSVWRKRQGFNPWVGKILWRRKWQPSLVFLPGRSHGQRSLAGYSPWGHRRVGHDWSNWHSLTVVKTPGKSYLHWITQPQKGKQSHIIIKDPRKGYTGYLILEQKQRAWHRRDGGGWVGGLHSTPSINSLCGLCKGCPAAFWPTHSLECCRTRKMPRVLFLKSLTLTWAG